MWDIPSSTLLAVSPDILPIDAPKLAVGEHNTLSPAAATREQNIAIIPIRGMITPTANILSQLFGGTDIASIKVQFLSAISDPEITGIILDIDSPGGLITGVEELASTITSARGTKPIVAYAYGNAASAAYWIACAADQIIAGPTTMLGSIGVALAVPKRQDDHWVEFVSSHAPYKRLDPQSSIGQEAMRTA